MKLSLPLPSLGKKAKTIVGLHYTDKYIRLLELGKDKKPISEPIEVSFEGRDKGTVLKEVVQEHGLSGKTASVCMHVNDGLLKFYRYPRNINKKDLHNAIEWSIKKELSAMKEETYYDYFILEPGAEEKQLGVVLVFSRKETVEDIRKMVEDAGLKLHILDYEIIAIVNYGLYHNLPIPFSILYIDYTYSILASYSPTNISYYLSYWSLVDFMKSKDEESLENFFTEIRNIAVLNDLSSMYVTGPILTEEGMVAKIMENLPVLGLLDLEELKPNFFIPYMLSIRGMEG